MRRLVLVLAMVCAPTSSGAQELGTEGVAAPSVPPGHHVEYRRGGKGMLVLGISAAVVMNVGLGLTVTHTAGSMGSESARTVVAGTLVSGALAGLFLTLGIRGFVKKRPVLVRDRPPQVAIVPMFVGPVRGVGLLGEF